MPDQPQHPPTIELGEARLRPLRMSDAEALYADLRDPAVTALTSYPVISVPLVESMIERSQSRWAAGELLKWGSPFGTMTDSSAPVASPSGPRRTAGRSWHTTWPRLTGAQD